MPIKQARKQARAALERLRSHIETQIRDGHWAVGTQLPTERELAAQFEVSRNTVRRLLREMEATGWIERHVGRGTFARIPKDKSSFELDAHSVNPEEVMEARLLIEPLLAKLVVTRASERELEGLQKLVAAGASAATMSEFERWDNELHKAIAASSKNHYLISIVEGIHAARQSPAWYALRRRGLTDDRRRTYQADHEAIVDALTLRDGDKARDAIAAHLGRVRDNLLLK
ncbi:MAG: FCD domain-containing protein [Alphaproteobacteria bacterium]